MQAGRACRQQPFPMLQHADHLHREGGEGGQSAQKAGDDGQAPGGIDLGLVLEIDHGHSDDVGAHPVGDQGAPGEQGVAMVLCTTGHDTAQLERIRRLSETLPVLLPANTSLGIALLKRLVELAAGTLGDEFDTEIFEVHHRNKRDTPSGTALSLGHSAARGRGTSLDTLRQDRLPGGERLRTPGSIGFAALRGGDVAGEHSVMFAGDGERLELVHRVSKRATFAHGALKAAQWLADQPDGLYEMSDVLGLN